jgi:hypothetical protein
MVANARAAIVVALLAGACNGDPRSQILVTVESDLSVPTELDQIRIEATSPDGTLQTSTANLGTGQLPLPRVLTMVHDGGALGPFHLLVRGLLAGATGLTREASVTFEPGQIRVLRVPLMRSCLTVSCPAGESTCGDGACISLDDAGVLEPWDGTPPPLDGGGQVCTGSPEICNNVDDDCDTRIDEDFDLTTDIANCGGCGVVCVQTNTTSSCIGGQCVITMCTPPYQDCDGMGRTGCETDTMTSTTHCGTCNNPCRGGTPNCCSGTCDRC